MNEDAPPERGPDLGRMPKNFLASWLLLLMRNGSAHGYQLKQTLAVMGLGLVDPATVYRTLSKLVDAGLLRRLELGPRMYYEHDYGYPQHEHMHCEQCGKMIEFQSPQIEATMREVCRQHQFHASGHTFVIRGTCAECNRARMTTRRLDLV